MPRPILRRHPDEQDTGRTGPGGVTPTWDLVVAAGADPPLTPEHASVALPLTDREVVALRGPGLSAEDREILAGFAAQLAAALASERLQAGATRPTRWPGPTSSVPLSSPRSVTICAHPLASIKAASSSLLSKQLQFGPEETDILLRTIDDESDRLSRWWRTCWT